MRLMCVTAHPDDEAGGFGGSLRLYAERGVETYVLCLTAGEAASHRGHARSDQELSFTRKKEFAAACEILKVARGEVLDYPDGALDRQDLYSVVRQITRRLREWRPDVIITFGPEGALTGHPDHSMVSLFATMAYHWAGRNNRYLEQLKNGLQPHRVRKLYYGTALFTLPDRPPISPAPSTTVIDIGAHFETKIAAFKAHETQAPLFNLFENMVRKRGRQELFHLAASTEPREMELETDLFAGLSK